jgi:Protein of unknown function (DUF1552)
MKPLSRRFVLKGIGTAMALPMLDAMQPLRTASAAAPAASRLLTFTYPLGMAPSGRPSGSASGLASMGDCLSTLEGYKDMLTVVSGVDNRSKQANGAHACGTGHMLTGSDIATSLKSLKVTYDQLVADKISAGTRFRSIELGTGIPGHADKDSGFDAAISRYTNWRDNNGLPAEINPANAFARLFADVSAPPGDTSAALAAEKRRRTQQSVLDSVKDQRARLATRLGAGDLAKLEEYYAGVRQLEMSLPPPGGGGGTSAACTPGTKPSGGNLQQRVKQMLDISVLAFKCDVTRVITFNYLDTVSDESQSGIFKDGGGHGYHIGITHANGLGLPDTAAWKIATNWVGSQFAYLIDELKKAALLDSSLLYLTTELANGAAHSQQNYVHALAGGANGRLKGGRFINGSGQGVGNILFSLLQAFDTGTTSFGSGYSSGLPGLITT